MAAPVIRPETSIWDLSTGEAFGFTPAVTSGTPTVWEATGLPEGLSITAGTGVIAGVPTRPGVYAVTLRCKNVANEYSTAIIIACGVTARPTTAVGAVELEVDMDTKVVWCERTLGVDTPPLFVKAGDKVYVSVGLRKGGVLQDCGVAAVACHLRSNNDEPLIVISDAFTKVGSNNTTRYLLRLDFSTTAARALLSGYDIRDDIPGAPGIHIFPMLEFQFTLETVSGVSSTFSPFTTRTFNVWLSQDLG